MSGGRLDEPHDAGKTHPWYLVLWLTGVDYFSTLGYQPGIALLAAGMLSPIATLILVAVTLFGALPVYAQVARRSYAGQGSIAMLESLLPGWSSKILVLVLLGFAGTDFVITMTLSAADAAQHAIENPILHPYIGEARMAVTCALLTLLTLVFLKGFREAMGLAAAVAVPYLLLNLVVLARGIAEIAAHPEILGAWRSALTARGDWTGIALASVIIFPKLALGLSGFETGVSVMPLVSGGREDGSSGPPSGRIRAARKLLASAAIIMSFLLVLSSFVTTLLVPAEAYAKGGPASGRAIAWLAHAYLGEGFGTLYDLSTIAILWFAGASAMAGLLSLVPRYLPRFGMAPRWVAFRRPLVLVLFAVCLIVTWAFSADVEAQGGAYATGVLVLILSAAVAVALALWREGSATRVHGGVDGAGGGGATGSVGTAGGDGAAGRVGTARRRGLSTYFWIVSAVFAFTLVDNVIERPDGVIIASAFIAGILVISAISRYRRATELRVSEVTFADEGSLELWREITRKKVNLVPLRQWSVEDRRRKVAEIARYYSVKGPLALIHVQLLDNRSDFLSPLEIKVSREDAGYTVEVSGAVAIANTIAYVSELIDPISLFLGLTRQNLMTQSLRYLLWGEGETGLMVYTILVRYWEETPEDDVRPLIFLMSE